ncbi:MAG: LytTR family transcriptional regulator [Clostridia bacterium]|nr:LytTR family transcriptional regulator [Clostridia bacterium]
MKVEIRVDPALTEPEAVIFAPRVTPELEALARQLEDEDARLTVHTERGAAFIPIADILRIYAERQAVRAQTTGGVYTVRQRLYELEAQLASHRFVRISNSEIVNARMITGMDFSLTGTIRLSLRGGVETYASRRYVSRIRRQFEV